MAYKEPTLWNTHFSVPYTPNLDGDSTEIVNLTIDSDAGADQGSALATPRGFTVKARSTNSDIFYLGFTSDVDSDTGVELAASAQIDLNLSNLNKLWYTGAVGEQASVIKK